MDYTAGIDVGSTYTKCVILSSEGELISHSLAPTGFKLTEVAEKKIGRASCRERV